MKKIKKISLSGITNAMNEMELKNVLGGYYYPSTDGWCHGTMGQMYSPSKNGKCY